tara:strand:- start:157 stop:1119 length:963 start_codon:yes stop_codon:yes gene_type:complete
MASSLAGALSAHRHAPSHDYWNIHDLIPTASTLVAKRACVSSISDCPGWNRATDLYFSGQHCELCDGAKVASSDMLAFARARNASGTAAPVICLGLGHSGTSSVAALFAQSGDFHVKTPLMPFWEESELVELNSRYLAETQAERYAWRGESKQQQQEQQAPTQLEGGGPKRPSLAPPPNASVWAETGERLLTQNAAAGRLWADYTHPAVWKDPRLVWTLHLWTPIFEAHREAVPLPLLVHVRRSPERVAESFEKRPEQAVGRSREQILRFIERESEWATWQLASWPGASISFDIDSLSSDAEVANHYPGGHEAVAGALME